MQKDKFKSKITTWQLLSTGSSPMCKENYANIRGSRSRDSHEAAVVRPVRSYYTFVPYLLYGAVQGCSCGFPQGSRVGYTRTTIDRYFDYPRRAIDRFLLRDPYRYSISRFKIFFTYIFPSVSWIYEIQRINIDFFYRQIGYSIKCKDKNGDSWPSEDRWQHEILEFLLLFTDFFILSISDSKLSLITKSVHKNTSVSLSFYAISANIPPLPHLESILEKRLLNLRSIK